MPRLIGRAIAIALIAALVASTASAQPKKQGPKAAAPPSKIQPPPPLPMGWPAYLPPVGPYPGMPVYSFARWKGLPPPPPEPLTYPFTGFVAGYPYPGYTMVYPYPRTVSSYSSGPSLSFPTGRVWGWR